MEVLQRTANRGSVSTASYDIDNSLKFEADNTEIIYRANESGTNRKTFTVSLWFKRTELGVDQEVWHGGRNGQTTVMGILSYSSADDNRWVDVGGGTGNTGTLYRSFTTRKIRDTSAWYHFVLAVDTTQATEANRMKVWLNGEEVTDWAQHQIPAQDFQCALESGTEMAWGGFRPSNVDLFSGYLAECHYLDGVAKVQTDFGEYDEDSGIWIPKRYTGTYGNNGCYMKFDNSSSMGADSSGNGNNFTLNNITAADQALDSPTNNFCTLNPLFTGFNSSVQLPLNGATQYGLSGGNQDLSYAGTMGVTKGKWYFENYINEVGSTYGARIYVGFHTFQQDYDGVQVGASTNGDALAVWQMDAGNYVAWNGGSRSITSGLGTVGSGGVGKFVGIALNLDDNQISFYYDGSAVTNGTNLSLYNMGSQTDDGIFAIPVVQSKGSVQTANFGGYIPSNFISSAASDENGYGTFEYAPPTGYYALCTKNLAEYG